MGIFKAIRKLLRKNKLPSPEDIRAQGGITMSKKAAKRKARESQKKLDREAKN